MNPVLRSSCFWLPAMLMIGTLPALTGCGPDEAPPDPDVPAEMPAAADEGIQVILAIDRATYSPGDSIRAVLQLSNLTGSPKTLHFPTAQRYDLRIVRGDGSEVYRWSGDQVFAQVTGEERLEGSGTGPQWEERLPVPAQPGQYRLRAMIAARDAELEADLPLEVSSSEGPGTG